MAWPIHDNRGHESGRGTPTKGDERDERQHSHEQVERGLPYQGINSDQNKSRSIPIKHPIGDKHSR